MGIVAIIAAGYYYKKKKKKEKISQKALDALRKLKSTGRPKDKPTKPTNEKDTLFSSIGSRALWKPIADSRGGVPVLLTPKGWPQQKVKLENDSGVVISNNIEYRGLTNGDRETYFFLDARAKNLPSPTILIIGDKRYQINDPEIRIG